MPEDQLKEIIDMQAEQLSSEHPEEICEESSEQVVSNILKSGEAAIDAAKENGNQAIKIIQNADADQTELLNANEAVEIANKELDAAGHDLEKQVTSHNQEEKQELTPEEVSYKKFIETINKFVIDNLELCRGKTYDELISQNIFGELGSQINWDDFNVFFKQDPEKATDYLLSIDDSSFGHLIVGELIDCGCVDVRFSENKSLGDMFKVYDRFVKHLGNEDFSGNPTVLSLKAQHQIAEIEKALEMDDADLGILIKDYDEAINNPHTENYLSSLKFRLEYRLNKTFKELAEQNKIQEAKNLYASIQYRSLIKDANISWRGDRSLLPNAGKSLLEALESTSMEEQDDHGEVGGSHYGQKQERLLIIQQSFLKEYPEVYFNAVMYKSLSLAPRGLDLSRISRDELAGFLENIKDLSFAEQEALLKQEVIESLCKVKPEKREQLIGIMKLLLASPSSEIQRFKSELIIQLTSSENPEEDLKKIESIFLKNCLPTVGKVSKVFQVLYHGEKLDGLVGEKSSPVLKKESSRGRQFQIYKDLLNIHLQSSNESLKDYLSAFQEGKDLFKKVEEEGFESLDQEEQKKIDYLLKRLEMLYESSWLNKESKAKDSETISERLENIKNSLTLKKDQKLIQRLEEMYLKPVGLTSIDQALEFMSQSGQKAEQRGLAYATDFKKDGARLASGDLLKGINSAYLDKILDNGSVAKEFLGDAASSDATPADTDVAMVMEQTSDASFKEIVANSIARDYGSLMIALKNRGQFFESDKEAIKPDQKAKLELFHTGVWGEQHYGIRTGFPSSEIDFFIAKSDLPKEELNIVYIQIARKGVYVPVVDEEGKLLFTPEMYKSIRPKDFDFSKFDSDSIRKELEDEKFSPQALLNSLKEVFSEEYIHGSGTFEGYSMEEHTLKVLSQFEKYFTGKNLPARTNEQFFRLLLALHDIGKPQAIDVGNKDYQHYYTAPVLKKVFEKIGFSAKENRLGEILTREDPVGAYLQEGKIEDSAQYILQKSAESGMTSEELLDLFIVFYKCDAGSYTENAGGQASLDDKFIFDEASRTVEFAPETELKINKLREMIK